MSRYIDADELEDTMLYGMCGTGYQTLALSLIKEVPTADVVEIVRCKDCKYEKTCCRNIIDDPDGIPVQIDYCSYGERKDGDEHERK